MNLRKLTIQSAQFYWRTNLAVTLGVAAAVAVLAGALVVGDSVRGSLRDIALGRLGRTDQVLSSMGFFREALSNDAKNALGATDAAPLIVADAFVTLESSGRRASKVLVYGVDERFWKFHGLPPPDGVMISPALATEVGGKEGDVLLTRLQKPSEVPIESLFGRKEDVGRTVRLTLAGVLPRDRLGEFAVKPQQAGVRAVFAPLRRLQRDLAVQGQVNTILVSGGERTDARLRSALQLEDLGVRVSTVDNPSAVVLESTNGIVGEPLETAARSAVGKLGTPTGSRLHLSRELDPQGRSDDSRTRSLTATDLEPVAARRRFGTCDEARRRCSHERRCDRPERVGRARACPRRLAIGSTSTTTSGIAQAGLVTRTATFTFSRVVPIAGLAADRRLAPDYPGITGSKSLADWDPPFPIDLSRVRPEDERYWEDHRATPKAFIAYERGRDLWRSRYGALTSIRLSVPDGADAGALAARLRDELRTTLSPNAMGVALYPARAAALEAAQGATDFGQYFTYFSFFLMVSALMLAVLFFKLGVEQRLRQIGILRAAGYSMSVVRRLLLGEAIILAVVGGVLGVAGAVLYGKLIVHGLGTWWVGAVGTTMLELHVQAGLARPGRDWCGRGRDALCPRLASRRRATVPACALDRAVARRIPSARRAQRAAQPAARGALRRPGARAVVPRIRDAVGAGRSLLRSRRRTARCARCSGSPAGCAPEIRGRSPAVAHGPSRGSGFAARHSAPRVACCRRRSSRRPPSSSSRSTPSGARAAS